MFQYVEQLTDSISKIQIFKNLNDNLQTIKLIEGNYIVIDEKCELNYYDCTLSKNCEIYNLKIFIPINDTIGRDLFNIYFKNLSFDNGLFCASTFLPKKGYYKDDYYILEGELLDIYSNTIDELKDKFYIRCIIPIDDNINLNSCFEELSSYKFSDTGFSNRSLMKLKIEENKEFHLFSYENSENFLIFESLVSISYREFNKIMYAVLYSLAFISGKLYHDQGYFFMSNDNLFNNFKWIFRTQHSKVTNGLPAISNNPFDFQINLRNSEVEEYYQKLKGLPISVFERMCQQTCKSEHLLRIFSLYMEAVNKEQTVQCILLYVCLENFREYLKIKDSKIIPIHEKDLWKNMRKELLVVYKKYENDILNQLPQSIKTKELIQNKINNINAPISSSSLIVLFDVLKITLSEEEKEIIEYRNYYLHGSNPLDVDENTLENVFYISSIMKMLITKLILKNFEYEGYILNYLRIYKETHKRDVTDDPFIWV